MSVLLAVAKGLIRERGRRASSWVLLGLMVFSGYSFLRSTGRVYDARGIYTSGYVGATVAQGSAWLFAILGFFLTRGSIENDRRSHVGEILASTPLKRQTYLLGKLLGSVVYLSMLMLVVCSMAAVMQLLYREAPVQPFELAWPFLLFTLPVIVFASGLALFFEVVPGLRQWPGDVLFVLVLLLDVCKGLSGNSLMWAAMFLIWTHIRMRSVARHQIRCSPGQGRASPRRWTFWRILNSLPQTRCSSGRGCPLPGK